MVQSLFASTDEPVSEMMMMTLESDEAIVSV